MSAEGRSPMAVRTIHARRTAVALLAGVAFWFAAPAALRAEPPAWIAEAGQKLPRGLIAGRVMRLDEEGLKATIAVFPAGADSVAHPGSVFTPLNVADVTLKSDKGVLSVVSVAVRARRAEEAPKDDDGADFEAEILKALAGKKKAEPGVEPCRIRGWSMDESRAGLAVRAAPADDAKIVGRLAPPLRTPDSGQGSEDGWRAEFAITGYKDGWFRISGATPPGTPYGDDPPKGYPKTYSGMGWVPATAVGGAYANTQMPVARLLAFPHVDAPGDEPGGPDGRMSIDGTLTRVLACSGPWVLSVSNDFRRGWWRGMCSNQATNCS
ncbi:SH3 domain-containing protein [Xanthobacter pseudotagetidis]|uniref:SH3 domain-containing protein n=1 Tax=Xanthobacter pseudotagetidis TaxID=3119911 RepID=UPI00372860CB